MSDSGIKKAIIKKNTIPAFYGKDQTYILRYRIVSEDRNRTSHWSPYYYIGAPSATSIQFSVSVDSTNKSIMVIWTPSANTINNFDVYINWNNSGWKFIRNTTSTVFAINYENDVSSFKIAVQTPTFPKERFAGATLFESNSYSV